MKITWIGQGGFIIDTADMRLVIDPYLSNSLFSSEKLERLFPPPVAPADLGADLVICTHNHGDHCDLETVKPLLKLEDPPLFAGPQTVVEELILCGCPEEMVTTLDASGGISIGDVHITATVAMHGDCPAVGLLLEDYEGRLYISGDTLYDEKLAKEVLSDAQGDIDVAIVCINGRWGNMNADEAAAVVDQLGVKLAVPMHYGLFAKNTADPQKFVDACSAKDVKSAILEVNKPVSLYGLIKKAANGS